jgi:hypothetical protein
VEQASRPAHARTHPRSLPTRLPALHAVGRTCGSSSRQAPSGAPSLPGAHRLLAGGGICIEERRTDLRRASCSCIWATPAIGRELQHTGRMHAGSCLHECSDRSYKLGCITDLSRGCVSRTLSYHQSCAPSCGQLRRASPTIHGVHRLGAHA